MPPVETYNEMRLRLSKLSVEQLRTQLDEVQYQLDKREDLAEHWDAIDERNFNISTCNK